MSEVPLERFYFVLFDDGLTFKTLKLAFIVFFYSNSSNISMAYNGICERAQSNLGIG